MSNSNTKKIRINLSAFTRVEYTEVLEVPANITPSELNQLTAQRYNNVDGGAFTDDPDYWEEGARDWSFLECDETDAIEASGTVTRNENGGFVVTFVPSSKESSMAYKHFNHDDDVRSYIESELLAALRDDLERMEGHEEQHYTDEDRETMRNKISDIESYFDKSVD